MKSITWNPRNHPKLLSQKSWPLGIRNGPIARDFWNLNQSIEQKVKYLQLEKCRYIKDIKITFWDIAQYFHSKQLWKSFETIHSLKFVLVGYKRPKSFFQIHIVTCSLMPASLNLQVNSAEKTYNFPPTIIFTNNFPQKVRKSKMWQITTKWRKCLILCLCYIIFELWKSSLFIYCQNW